jgi:hypothetical protein
MKNIGKKTVSCLNPTFQSLLPLNQQKRRSDEIKKTTQNSPQMVIFWGGNSTKVWFKLAQWLQRS